MKNQLFRFFISGEEKEVSTDSDLWELLLLGDRAPGEKKRSAKDIAGMTDVSLITVGDYFTAVTRFLSENNFLILKKGLTAVFENYIHTKDIRQLDVILEKHGAFYHPLRLEVILENGNTCLFVINGAISKQGLAIIQNEFQIINRLNEECTPSYLLGVFGCNIFQMGDNTFGFFLGQWLDGFKEFHITRIKNNDQKIVIWNSDGSSAYMDEAQAFPIYGEIAKILTLYYDLETFHQIYPWHHAAGDFIIRLHESEIDTRLITIRGYENLTDFDLSDSDSTASDAGTRQSVLVLPSLLMFFLNLSLRVRLDRLDGTGESVAVNEKVLPFIVDGFLAALDQKGRKYNEPDIKDGFIDFFKQFDLNQIIEMMVNILASHPPGPFEIEQVKEILVSHCKGVHVIFNSI